MGWIEECNKKGKDLPKETRQKFMDYLFAGNNLGQAAKLCQIDNDTATGVLNMQIKTHRYFKKKVD